MTEPVNTPEVAQLFADLDESRNRLAVLEDTAANLDRLRAELDEATTPEALLLRPSLDEWPETTRKWWEEKVATKLDLAATSAAVRKAAYPASERSRLPCDARRARDAHPADRRHVY